MRIEVQYPTRASLKCQAKGFGLVQEVFLVTQNPDALAKKLKEWQLK